MEYNTLSQEDVCYDLNFPHVSSGCSWSEVGTPAWKLKDMPSFEYYIDRMANFPEATYPLWNIQASVVEIKPRKLTLSEKLRACSEAVPKDAWNDIPSDLSTRLDEYLYSIPKEK